MTPEERAKEEAWTMWAAEQKEPGGLMAISPRLLDRMFPFPDMSSMTPEQAETAQEERESSIRAFLIARGGPMPDSRRITTLVRPTATPATSPSPSEVPVS